MLCISTHAYKHLFPVCWWFQQDLSQKYTNAPAPYPTRHHFITEIQMYTCVHISVTKLCLVGYLFNALWDLWAGSIGSACLRIPCIYGYAISCQHNVPQSTTPWWRHQMETFSALMAICAGNSPVPGEFPTQMPVTRSFDVYFDLRLNKRLCKQSWGWWFETLLCPLWRHSNAPSRLLVIVSTSRTNEFSQEMAFWFEFNWICPWWFSWQYVNRCQAIIRLKDLMTNVCMERRPWVRFVCQECQNWLEFI